MKEFMLFVRATGNPVFELTFKEQQNHVKKIGDFIQGLVKEGKLKSAQPFKMEGVMISSKGGELSESDYREGEEVIAGYYHIEVENMDEALRIARSDPRFEDSDWRIEVRPIMTMEGINL